MIRIVIADDHATIREGISAMLACDPGIEVIGEAKDGAAAVAMYRRHRPDIILLDVAMPKMGGLDAARAIRREFCDARIIFLSMSEAEEDIYQGISAGAGAYLPKTIDGATLVNAIRAVAAGGSVLPSGVASALIHRIQTEELTEREAEVLTWVARGETNASIGSRLFIAEGTIRGHISHILRKLGARDRTHAVAIAIRRGLLRM